MALKDGPNERRFCNSHSQNFGPKNNKWDISKYSSRSNGSTSSSLFKTNFTGLFYDYEEAHEKIRFSSTKGAKIRTQEDNETCWKSNRDRMEFGLFKLNKSQLTQINFDNLRKKIKGKKKRKRTIL